MTTPARILIIEDEQKIARLLADYLQAAGYAPQLLHSGLGAIEHIRAEPPDLILLDLMLPGRDGLEICRELRSFSQVPVIMVTARVEEIDRLLGLEIGADDYICKPFSPREVVARVRAILRRVQPGATVGSGDVQIDEAQHRATFKGQPLELTPVEFRLLKALSSTPGRVHSRQQLLDSLYLDHRIVTDRTVDSHVKNLRRKLQQIDAQSEHIQSIYGVGYKYEPS